MIFNILIIFNKYFNFRLLPIAALTDLNEDTKEKEKIEMFNNLVNFKKYKVPLEDEIPNWVLAGKHYVKD